MKTVLVVIVLLGALLTASHVQASGIHSLRVNSVFQHFNESINMTLWTGTRGDALQQVIHGHQAYYVDTEKPTATQLTAAEAASIAILDLAEVGICVGYNISNSTSLKLSVDQVAWLIRGDGNFEVAPAVNATDISLLLDVNDTLVHDFIERLAEYELPLSSTAAGIDSFKAAYASRSKVQVATMEGGVMQLLKAVPNAVGLMSFFEARAKNIPCAQLLVPHPTYPQVVIPTTPRMGIGAAEAHYPFWTHLYFIASKTLACKGSHDEEWLSALVAMISTTTSEFLHNWDAGTFADLESVEILHEALEEGVCTVNARLVHAGGSTAMGNVASAWSRRYAEVVAKCSSTVLVVYRGGSGKSGVLTGTLAIGASESLFSESQFAAHPNIQFVPSFAFAVSVVYKFPRSNRLVLPRCTLTGIYSGAVRYWDHPNIVAENPTLTLPHQEIIVFARSGSSGTTSIFTHGLKHMDEECSQATGNQTHFHTDTWNVSFANLKLVASTAAMITAVQETTWSIGYASFPEASVYELPSATLMDEDTLTLTAPTRKAVLSGLETIEVHPTRLTVEFHINHVIYPFMGVTYWVYNRDTTANCEEMRGGLEFIGWVAEDEDATTIATSLHLVELPSYLRIAGMEAFREAKCQGQFLLPQLPSPPYNYLWVILLCSFLVVAVVVPLTIFYVRWRKNAMAPKDSTTPFAVFFVGPRNMDVVEALHPEMVTPIMDAFDEVLKKAVKQHSCYSVRYVGYHRLIVANNIVDALHCCQQTVTELMNFNFTNPTARLERNGTFSRHSSRAQRQSPDPTPLSTSNTPLNSPSNSDSHTPKSLKSPETPKRFPRALSAITPKGSKRSLGYHPSSQSTRESFVTHITNVSTDRSIEEALNDTSVSFAAGVHYGTPRIIHDEEMDFYDYTGPVVDLAAAVAGTALPHQILVTEAVEAYCDEMAVNLSNTGYKLSEFVRVPIQGTERALFCLEHIDLPIIHPPKESDMLELAGNISSNTQQASSKRITVAVICVSSLLTIDSSERTLEEVLDELDDIVHKRATQHRGHVYSFVDHEIVITFNAAFPAPNQVSHAASFAHDFAEKVFTDLGTRVWIGICTGQALVLGKPAGSSWLNAHRLVVKARALCSLCQVHIGTRILMRGTFHAETQSVHQSQFVDCLHLPFQEGEGSTSVMAMMGEHEQQRDDEWLYQLENAEKGDPFAIVNAAFDDWMHDRFYEAREKLKERPTEFTRDVAAFNFLTEVLEESPLNMWLTDKTEAQKQRTQNLFGLLSEPSFTSSFPL